MDTKAIETILGINGMMMDDVLKISMPRKDLKVTVDGFDIIPFMGLTSWVAFRQGPHQTTLMGDIVVLEDEIHAAVSAAIESGLYVTALHNHFIREQPPVMFTHIEATADEATLAGGVRRILDGIAVVRQARPVAAAATGVKSTLNTERLDQLIGSKGEFKDGVYKVTLGRADVPVKCQRCGDLDINAAMGYNTWAAFQGTEERAAVCGDVAMLEEEVAPVIRELHAGGIEVVAVHNHMFFEEPRVIFLHYWGIGAARDLASTFKRALNQQQKGTGHPTCCSS